MFWFVFESTLLPAICEIKSRIVTEQKVTVVFFFFLISRVLFLVFFFKRYIQNKRSNNAIMILSFECLMCLVYNLLVCFFFELSRFIPMVWKKSSTVKNGHNRKNKIDCDLFDRYGEIWSYKRNGWEEQRTSEMNEWKEQTRRTGEIYDANEETTKHKKRFKKMLNNELNPNENCQFIAK